LLYEPVLNSSNQLAFVALLDRDGGESDYGLWVGSPDNLQMVVGPAHILPGAPAGFEFSSFPFHYRTGENGLLMNSRGDVVFPAQLAPPGPGPSLRGIWAYIGKSLQKVAMEGDVIDVAPDPFVNDFKVVSSIGAVGGTGGTDGRRSSLNDARQLVLEIRFTDGTEGLFLTRLVPEPSSSALLISAMVILSMRRDRVR
jgi:hypothetical protein